MNHVTIDDIVRFVIEQAGPFEPWRKPLARESVIDVDLKIDGDDAKELMVAFFKRFNVDPGNYEFDNYFEAEAVQLHKALLGLFQWVTGRPTKFNEKLTLGDLERAARLGKFADDRFGN